MTIHEIVTLCLIVGPVSYFVGRFDENRADESTIPFCGMILAGAVVSAAVAITLRFSG